VLSSGRLMEAALDLAAARVRPPAWLSSPPQGAERSGGEQ
jgi:hypothetical protein